MGIFFSMVALVLYSALVAFLGFCAGGAKRSALQRYAHFRGYHEAMKHAAQEAEVVALEYIAGRDYPPAMAARELRSKYEAMGLSVRGEFTDVEAESGPPAAGA